MGNCAACKGSNAFDAMGAEDATKCLEYSQVLDEGPLCLKDAARPAKQEPAATEPAATQAGRQSIVSPADAEAQLAKVTTHDGFFAVLSKCNAPKAGDTTDLRFLGITENDQVSEVELHKKVHDFRSRTITNPQFDGQRVVGCIIPQDSLDETVCGMPCSKYLWKEKRIVPIMSLDVDLAPEHNGVQLMEVNERMLDQVLTKASEQSVFGVRVRSVIRNPNAVGIKSLIDQQFQVCRKIAKKNLVPVLQPEVLFDSADKLKCEHVLIDVLIDALDKLSVEVILFLTIPTSPNSYLPFTRHNNILRMAALSCGYDRSTACKMVKQNVSVVAGFARAFVEDLSLDQSDEDFTRQLDASCQSLYQASQSADDSVEKLARITEQPGFIILMTPTAIMQMLEEEQQTSDNRDKMHECFKRIVLSGRLNSARVIAMCMTMEFCSVEVNGMPASRYLWDYIGIIPLLIFSLELQAEKKGVQMLEVPPDFDDILKKAKTLEVFIVQLRGMIKQPNQAGIDKLVSQQFSLSKKVIDMGLLPNMMLEVDVSDHDKKVQCEEMLINSILSHLGNLTPEQKVTFTLTMPSKPNLYLSLVQHPNTLRVGAASRGYSCADACRKLSDNAKLIGVFGRAFTERLEGDPSEKEVKALVADICKKIYHAVTSVSAKEEQLTKVTCQDGFFAVLDSCGNLLPKALKRYGIDANKLSSKKDMTEKYHQIFTRIVTDDNFNGSRVIGIIMAEHTMNLSIGGLPAPKFLWSQKGTVPFLTIDNGLLPEEHGVQLMQLHTKNTTQLMNLFDKAASAGIFGTKQRSFIKLPDQKGIKAVVDQQIELARQACAKGLLPLVMIEVDIASPAKAICEQLLLDMLLDAINQLRSNEKIVLLLTLPNETNLYLTLMSHPNVVRCIAVSAGHNQKIACEMLKTNVNLIGGFGRAFVEDLSVTQKDEEFSKVLDQACYNIFDASKRVEARQEQMIKLSDQDGFLVRLDQDLHGMQEMLKKYGIRKKQYKDEASMMEKANQFQSRVVTNPSFNGSRCLGVILSENATAFSFARLPAAKYLWEVMHVIPFMKLDKGLAAEEDGVCHMKEIRHLRQKLDKAVKAGAYGTVTRSVVRLPNQAGIRSVVDQQMQVAKSVMLMNLIPIIDIEIEITSSEKAKCERMLVNVLCRALEELEPDQRVVLHTSLPESPGTYSRLVEHPRVIRVACRSGGYSFFESLARLQQNDGVIASFGRAFVEGLHVTQTEMEFTSQIEQNTKLIYSASRVSDDSKLRHMHESGHTPRSALMGG